jgi:hypothetical protein
VPAVSETWGDAAVDRVHGCGPPTNGPAPLLPEARVLTPAPSPPLEALADTPKAPMTPVEARTPPHPTLAPSTVASPPLPAIFEEMGLQEGASAKGVLPPPHSSSPVQGDAVASPPQTQVLFASPPAGQEPDTRQPTSPATPDGTCTATATVDVLVRSPPPTTVAPEAIRARREAALRPNLSGELSGFSSATPTQPLPGAFVPSPRRPAVLPLHLLPPAPDPAAGLRHAW